MNNQSGDLSLSRPLDYETAVQHVLNISASDLGQPRRQTFTDVTVHVTDVNDNSPVLEPRTVQVSLEEVRLFYLAIISLVKTNSKKAMQFTCMEPCFHLLHWL